MPHRLNIISFSIQKVYCFISLKAIKINQTLTRSYFGLFIGFFGYFQDIWRGFRTECRTDISQQNLYELNMRKGFVSIVSRCYFVLHWLRRLPINFHYTIYKLISSTAVFLIDIGALAISISLKSGTRKYLGSKIKDKNIV